MLDIILNLLPLIASVVLIFLFRYLDRQNRSVELAKKVVAEAKQELDNLHSTTVKLMQQYEAYKAQYKALATAQLDLLNSEAFNIELAKVETIVVCDTPVAEPLFQEAAAKVAETKAADTEEDLDETVTMEDDTMIKDIASIFDK